MFKHLSTISLLAGSLLLTGCDSVSTQNSDSENLAEPAASNEQATSVPTCSFDNLNEVLEGKPLGSILLNEVPDESNTCSFYLMGWNNFLYLAGTDDKAESKGKSRMMTFAPWYYVDLPFGEQKITPYPQSPVGLNPSEINKFKGQAGDGWDVHTANQQAVVYDVRMNQTMYDYIVAEKAYCPSVLDSNGLNLSFPPNDPEKSASQGNSIEYKSAWVDFGNAASCPSSEMLCEGQFGLVGLHLAQKIEKHGEWIWWSYEYAGNSPDCEASIQVSDKTLSTSNKISSRDDWLFFDENKWKKDQPSALQSDRCMTPTEKMSFMDTNADLEKICAGEQKAPSNKQLCNQNPLVDFLASTSDDNNFTSVNVCRTDSLPNADEARKENFCVLSGDADKQGAQLACLNDDVNKGKVSIANNIANVWAKNYIQIGSEWTKSGMPITAPGNTGGLPISNPGSDPEGLYVKSGFPNLANTVLETWMQLGSQVPYCAPSTDDSTMAPAKQTALDCLVCHKAITEGPNAELPSEGRVNFSHLLERVVDNNKNNTVCP